MQKLRVACVKQKKKGGIETSVEEIEERLDELDLGYDALGPVESISVRAEGPNKVTLYDDHAEYTDTPEEILFRLKAVRRGVALEDFWGLFQQQMRKGKVAGRYLDEEIVAYDISPNHNVPRLECVDCHDGPGGGNEIYEGDDWVANHARCHTCRKTVDVNLI